MQGGILSTTRPHHSRCLSPNAPTLTPRALSLRQNLHSFGPPFSICAVSPAGLQALGGQLPYTSCLCFCPNSAKPRVRPRGSAWLSKNRILPLPVAAHVGVLGVEGEDGLQEGADEEPCHRERHPGPCAGEQRRQRHYNQTVFPGICLGP